MPNRILRDWTDSLKFDTLSAEAERLFVRLIMKADDFARFHADTRLVGSACFPLSNYSQDSIAEWMAELEAAGLIVIYQSEGRSYLSINKFRQDTRAKKSKFPAPEQESAMQMHSTCTADATHMRSETDTYSETETETAERVSIVEAILSAYPRKSHVREAREAVINALERAPASEILSGTLKIAAIIKTWPGGGNNRYVPAPHNFFNTERWKDEPDTWKRKNDDGDCAKPNPRNAGVIKGPTDYGEAIRRKAAEQSLARQMAANGQPQPPAVNGVGTGGV